MYNIKDFSRENNNSGFHFEIYWENVLFRYMDDEGRKRFFFGQIHRETREILWIDAFDYTKRIDCLVIAKDALGADMKIRDFGKYCPHNWRERELREIPNVTPRHWATHPEHPLNYIYKGENQCIDV